MRFLDGVYGTIAAARNSLYETGFFETHKLQWPVVSVGNISVGGSGKTPFVIMLGEMLAEKGYWVDVLSRGYGRKTRGILAVNANGSPEEYGDEPLLIARKLSCPVTVGADRYAAGLQAERGYAQAASNPIHLLDDGFQHRRLHRDFDIVLLSHRDLEDRLLPMGRLREPLSSLGRADAIVVEPECRVPKGNFKVWHAERHLQIPPLTGPVIAFCSIGNPMRFFTNLRDHRLDVREEIAFRDHHRYTSTDVQRLVLAQKRTNGSCLVTTEKDAINLGVHLTTLKPIVVPIRMKVVDPEGVMKHILGTIAQRRGLSRSGKLD